MEPSGSRVLREDTTYTFGTISHSLVRDGIQRYRPSHVDVARRRGRNALRARPTRLGVRPEQRVELPRLGDSSGIARRLHKAMRRARRAEAWLIRLEAAHLAYLAAPGRREALGFVSLADLGRELFQMSETTVRERIALDGVLGGSP